MHPVLAELILSAFIKFRKPPPPPPPPPAMSLSDLGTPALLAVSLVATALVMIVASWLLSQSEESKVPEQPGTSAPPPPSDKFSPFERKMRAEGLSVAAIKAFKHNYAILASGQSTLIAEDQIQPVKSLPALEDLAVDSDASLLSKTVMLKLNGGLGTGMGLAKAKSLLVVRDRETFLDLIAKQVESMCTFFGEDITFMLMNSFSTSSDTLEYLAKYPNLPKDRLEFVQNKAPKVNASTLAPVSWPKDHSHEWCPPGHGDLYPAMLGSGTLDRLIAAGKEFIFVSNSDNLGATLDLKLLSYFVQSGAPFMVEAASRTEADKKGGHLAADAQTGNLLLRESAQCPKEAEKDFQDVSKYMFFNTNNIWINLAALREAMAKHGGLLPLPLIKNAKTVDPRDKSSTKVFQLETAMGSAIACFEGAIAVRVPRSRFAPVKTTADLMAVRSDAYVTTPDFRVELAPARNGVPPFIKLDDKYKFVDALDQVQEPRRLELTWPPLMPYAPFPPHFCSAALPTRCAVPHRLHAA